MRGQEGSDAAGAGTDGGQGVGGAAEGVLGTQEAAEERDDRQHDDTAASTSKKRKLVLVFDYDWSLINVNSDTYVFQELAPEVLGQVLAHMRENGEWTRAIDFGLVKLQSEHGVNLGQIQACLENVPVLDNMLQTLQIVAAAGGETLIVSDANQFFIDVFLEKQGLKPLVREVVTNKSRVDENGLLRASPYWPEDQPHACRWCPKNLCKGAVLDRLGVLADPETSVVYVGDGAGDFCPGLRLREQDSLLVRHDPAYTSALGLHKRIEKYGTEHPMRAQTVRWTSAGDIIAHLGHVAAL